MSKAKLVGGRYHVRGQMRWLWVIEIEDTPGVWIANTNAFGTKREAVDEARSFRDVMGRARVVRYTPAKVVTVQKGSSRS